MLLGWFDAKAANVFGTELASFFVTRIPLDMQQNEKKFAIKTSEVLGKMSLRVSQFKATHKLNLYTKAQLANSFKWALRDAGYAQPYSDELTQWLVKQL